MSEKEKKVQETFNKVLPELTDEEMDKLLAFGEGMAFMAKQRKADSPGAETGPAG